MTTKTLELVFKFEIKLNDMEEYEALDNDGMCIVACKTEAEAIDTVVKTFHAYGYHANAHEAPDDVIYDGEYQ